jgi:hypothetical protein
MPKKKPAGGSKNTPSSRAGGNPPPLSDKLIAQLQGVVSAAQRERLSQPTSPASEVRPPRNNP